MSIVTLFENEWLSLKKVVAPERGVNGYIFSHEARCKGCIIAVLPFRTNGDTTEYLIRSEVTPCWGLEPVCSALTGGWEGGEPVEDAKRELKEEAGYTAEVSEFIELGGSYASKSSDTIYALFAVDLTGKEMGVADGDGSVLEAEGKCIWMSEQELVHLFDPQLHVMLNRLKAVVKESA